MRREVRHSFFCFLGLRICLILTYGCVSGGRVAVGGGDGCGDVVDGLFFWRVGALNLTTYRLLINFVGLQYRLRAARLRDHDVAGCQVYPKFTHLSYNGIQS